MHCLNARHDKKGGGLTSAANPLLFVLALSQAHISALSKAHVLHVNANKCQMFSANMEEAALGRLGGLGPPAQRERAAFGRTSFCCPLCWR